MTDLLNDLDLAPERETVKEPSKRWFNWWLIVEPSFWSSYGPLSPGEIVSSRNSWPSQEIAEQKARDCDAREIAEKGRLKSGWLGAYPEGSRP